MMPNMTEFKFGDVVLVPFPFTDQSTSKQRPAVVISSAKYLSAKPDLIIMAVTSQLHQARSSLEVALAEWKRQVSSSRASSSQSSPRSRNL